MKKRVLGLSTLALAGVLAFTGCGCSIDEEDGKAWAEENGYVKDAAAWAKDNGYVKAEDYNIVVGADVNTSATATGQGGLNYGDVDWTEDLKKAAIKEYLKGDDGNYREMYSVATSLNNNPSIANVEYVLNTTTFELFGGSEKNTNKLNEMKQNPNVSLYWTRQLRTADVTNSYFQSYGVEIEGTVKFYDYANLTGEERTNFIATGRNYFKTMGIGYAKYYDSENPNYMSDDAIIQYFVNAGTVYYSIVPKKITITSPYLLFLMYNATADRYEIAGTEKVYEFADNSVDSKTNFLSNDFLDSLLARVRDVKDDQTIVTLNGVMAGNPGLKTQATLTFED